METVIENVTPKKAEAWLNRNATNRPLREGRVEQYASDMRGLKWTSCPVPISFYEDGDIADGQHRLFAIVESGTTQRFNITRGLTREDGLNIDTGVPRNVVDAVRIAGLETKVSLTLLSAARSIVEGKRSTGQRSNSQKLEPLESYREAAEFVASHVPRAKYLGHGVVLGAVGRAYLHEQDTERLERFCAVLRNGLIANDGESAAIALRNYLMTKGSVVTTATMWTDTFKKAQHAVYQFMRGRPMHIVREVKEEHYPLVAPTAKPSKGFKAPGKKATAAQMRLAA